MMGSIDKGRSQARGQLRKHLLRGTSVVALVTALGTSQGSAQSLSALRASVTGANAQVAKLLKPQAPATPTQNTAGMSAEEARALQYQSQVAQAISLAQQAQSAARTAVLGAEPAVPDGLVFGGLNPVADPVPAAQDPTGLNTWQGASAPTETTTGNKVQVTIQQTQQNAILSWQTFNVGPNTTLDFNQTQGGVAQPGWVVLNRVVGQLDPLTGLRNPNLTPAPSQIFGTINAQGTVLIINQNGILFGGSSQINVNSLIATSLEVGRAIDADSGAILNIADRNQDFLNYGLLGYADQASPLELPSAFTFSSQAISSTQYDALEGEVEVNAGADIQAGTGGFVLLTGPKVVNSGSITAPEGQVSLQSGRLVTLQTSDGSSTSIDPNVRGFVVSALDQSASAGNYALNTATGIIDAPQGYVSLQATDSGAVINDGILEATTSVSRNGFIRLDGGDIQLGLGSTIAIGPDASAETIPQDPTSLEDFKPSGIDIGTDSSRIEIQQNAMIYAPSGNITIGADPGPDTNADLNSEGTSRIFIDTGAVIDAAGLPDVVIPASRNAIEISPVTANSLADSPDYRDGFLNGATVYVDPRISGVSADGVAWVGSPLIPAQSYAEQVGVTVQELMTPGGNVTLGVQSSTLGPTSIVPDVTVKSGAVIDVSGGWVTYQAGWVQTTELVDASGNIVNIADADPNDTFIGIYDGYVENQARWGISQTYANPLLLGSHYEGQYSEGRDAGSLTIKGSTVVLDGTVYANAFPGPLQIADAQIGTASSSIYGDQRTLQAAPSQLPSGGFLFVQAFGTDTTQGVITGGGDIDVVDQADYEPVSSSLIYGQSVSIDANGNLVVPTRDPASFLPQTRIDTIMLSADAISNMGLSDVSLETSGQIDLAQGADITLAPGGVFNAEAGRTITVDGNVSVPSGTIDLQTIDLGIGSVYVPETAQLGSFDVVVNGSLSARGSWVNDYQATPASLVGSAYLDGGNIDISVAPRVTLYEATASVADTLAGNAPTVNVDISGSILINDGALLDVSGGGYVAPNGALTLTAKGGNVSLIDATTYFQLTDDSNKPAGGIEGFRVTTIDNVNGTAVIPVNPNVINSRVSIADGSILAAGFGGGGTFTLTTPAFSFGDGTATTGTELPMGFISQTGFANYNITSYATDLLTNTFNNGLGGYNAVLAAQTLTVGPGQTLLLTQTTFSPILTAAQGAQLRGLQTGGDLYSVLTPSIAPDAWDQHAVNLTLGGLIELDVANGGEVLGAAGGTLTVSKLENSGTISIPGGTIHQLEVLPQIYGQGDTLGAQNLDQVFTTNPDGSMDEGAQNAAGIANLTNAQLAAQYQVYLLGDLGANVGIYLAPGSVTDLSGVSIRDPRASEPGYTNFTDGRVIAGGTLESTPSVLGTSQLFAQTIGVSVYTSEDSVGLSLAEQIDAAPGATIGLAGASDVFDRLGPSGAYVPTPVWSNAGTLDLGNGGTLAGANIDAHGGAPAALGGTLVMLDPVLYQNDPQAPTENAISSAAISASGFETFVAVGSVSSVGNVQLDLGRGFFLTSPSYPGFGAIGDNFAPTISSGGTLEIDAPYINLDSILQTLSTPDAGTVANNSVILSADQIDIEGAVLFDQSVANVSLDATGDIRLIGVEPYQQTLNINTENVPNSLAGQLAVNGNLTITAGQIYPTTGSTFYVTSSAANGTIAIAKAAGATPSTPYSAGGNLTIQAANIVQGGVVRVPIGSLTIGGNSALTIGSSVFAPATESVAGAERKRNVRIRQRSLHSLRHDDRSDGMVFFADQFERVDGAASGHPDVRRLGGHAQLGRNGRYQRRRRSLRLRIHPGDRRLARRSRSRQSRRIQRNQRLSISRRPSGLRHCAGTFVGDGGGIRPDLFGQLFRSLFGDQCRTDRLSERRAGTCCGLVHASACTIRNVARRHARRSTDGRGSRRDGHRDHARGRLARGCGLLRNGGHKFLQFDGRYLRSAVPERIPAIFADRAHLCRRAFRGVGGEQRRGLPAASHRRRASGPGAVTDACDRHDFAHDAGTGRARRGSRYQRLLVRHRVDAARHLARRHDRAHRGQPDQPRCRKPPDRRRAYRQCRRHDVARYHGEFDHDRKRCGAPIVRSRNDICRRWLRRRDHCCRRRVDYRDRHDRERPNGKLHYRRIDSRYDGAGCSVARFVGDAAPCHAGKHRRRGQSGRTQYRAGEYSGRIGVARFERGHDGQSRRDDRRNRPRAWRTTGNLRTHYDRTLRSRYHAGIADSVRRGQGTDDRYAVQYIFLFRHLHIRRSAADHSRHQASRR
jgi:filamentous hemagglutinin family protein